MRPLGKLLLLGRRSGLPKRVRELVIDRVCARCGCEYEWGVHVAFFAADAGVDPATVDATVHAPPGSSDWTPDDAAVIALVDELHDGGRIADATWDALAARFSQTDLLTLVVLVGWYHAIAWVANGARVPLEDWAARFPSVGALERVGAPD